MAREICIVVHLNSTQTPGEDVKVTTHISTHFVPAQKVWKNKFKDTGTVQHLLECSSQVPWINARFKNAVNSNLEKVLFEASLASHSVIYNQLYLEYQCGNTMINKNIHVVPAWPRARYVCVTGTDSLWQKYCTVVLNEQYMNNRLLHPCVAPFRVMWLRPQKLKAVSYQYEDLIEAWEPSDSEAAEPTSEFSASIELILKWDWWIDA